MLYHELLLALGGCPGQVFQPQPCTRSLIGFRYLTNPLLEGITAAEAETCNRLLLLGSYYQYLSDFSFSLVEKSTILKKTIINHILQPYQLALVSLEAQVVGLSG